MITQDLTKIHAAHFQDQDTEERIHWSKYSVMAEAIAPLALYQARGDIVAGLAQSGGVQYLLADTPLLDEEVSSLVCGCVFLATYASSKTGLVSAQ